MKKTKVNKIINTLEKITILGAVASSVIYVSYIIVISVVNYLHNRPVKEALLYTALGFILVIGSDIYTSIQSNKQRTHKHTTQLHNCTRTH